MQCASTGLVTHQQVERLLGGGARGARQRQRLQRHGLLPEPCWLRFDRRRLGLLPDLILALLIIAGGDSRPTRLIESVHSRTQTLLARRSFVALREWLREAGRAGASSTFEAVLARSASESGDLFAAWYADLDTVIAELAPVGVGLDRDLGRVVTSNEDGCSITVRDHIQHVAPRSVAMDACPGLWVAVDHVAVLGDTRDFILPALRGGDADASTGGPAAARQTPLIMPAYTMIGRQEGSPFAAVMAAAQAGRIELDHPRRVIGDAESFLASRRDEVIDTAPPSSSAFAEEPRSSLRRDRPRGAHRDSNGA